MRVNSFAAAPSAECQVSADDRVRRVDELDLEPVVYKLMHPEPGVEALSLAAADKAVALYRCFLKLCVLRPRTSIVPNKTIDEVWHMHLLDTDKYRGDCNFVFGYFIEHFPYAGLGGADDRYAWREDYARTRRLFLEHFGVDIGAEPAASVCRNHGDGSECCLGRAAFQVLVRPRPMRT